MYVGIRTTNTRSVHWCAARTSTINNISALCSCGAPRSGSRCSRSRVVAALSRRQGAKVATRRATVVRKIRRRDSERRTANETRTTPRSRSTRFAPFAPRSLPDRRDVVVADVLSRLFFHSPPTVVSTRSIARRRARHDRRRVGVVRGAVATVAPTSRPCGRRTIVHRTRSRPPCVVSTDTNTTRGCRVGCGRTFSHRVPRRFDPSRGVGTVVVGERTTDSTDTPSSFLGPSNPSLTPLGGWWTTTFVVSERRRARLHHSTTIEKTQ